MHNKPKENQQCAPSQAEKPINGLIDDDWLRMAKLMISVMHIQRLGRIHPMIMIEIMVNWLSVD